MATVVLYLNGWDSLMLQEHTYFRMTGCAVLCFGVVVSQCLVFVSFLGRSSNSPCVMMKQSICLLGLDSEQCSLNNIYEQPWRLDEKRAAGTRSS